MLYTLNMFHCFITYEVKNYRRIDSLKTCLQNRCTEGNVEKKSLYFLYVEQFV